MFLETFYFVCKFELDYILICYFGYFGLSYCSGYGYGYGYGFGYGYGYCK